MSEPARPNPAEPPRRHPAAFLLAWLDAPAVKASLPLICVLAALALGAADIVVKRESKVEIAQQTWGFFALTGFVAAAVFVLAVWPLRTLLSRSEDYYPARRQDAAARAEASEAAKAKPKERGHV